MRNNRILSVHGCRKILKYSTETIILLLSDRIMTVRGKCLTCISYYVGAVGIEGEIEGLDYSPICDGEAR